MEKLKKDHFKLVTDENGIEYLVQAKDELTKNHRKLETREQRSYMMENKTDPLCPIVSYKKYMQHLNPCNDYLWQTPLQKVDELSAKVWYSKAHMGKNPLSKFMSDLSKNCHLSQIYHNHSIRATGCTITGRRFNAKVAINWSGHKSVQSLTMYQKVSHEEKLAVSKSLNESLGRPPANALQECENTPALPSTSRQEHPPQLAIEAPLPENEENIPENDTTEDGKALVPLEIDLNDENWEEDFDFDLHKIISDVEKEHQQKKSNNIVQNKSVPKSQMFSGCKIGTINLQIHNHYK